MSSQTRAVAFSLFTRRLVGPARAAGFVAIASAVACAASDQEGKLDEGTLTASGAAGTSSGGSAGANAVGGAGSGGVAGVAGGAGANTSGTGAATAGAGNGGAAGVAGSSSGGATGGTAVGGAAGSSGAGGSSAGGSGGAGGGGAGTGFRYAKLVATSEQSGKPWSSCAELQLLTTGGALIPRDAWTVTADSEESDDESAPSSAVKDGDTATFWHTAWEPGGVGDAPLPHQLVIDTGKLQAITGFTYLPRQDGENGRIAGYEFYLSKDGSSWGDALKTGTFPNDASEQKVMF